MAKEEEKKTVKVAEGEKTKSSEKQEGAPEAESLANVTWQRDSGRLSRPQSAQRVHNVTGGPATNTPSGDASEGEEEQNNSQERGRSRPPTGLSVPSSKTDKKNPHHPTIIHHPNCRHAQQYTPLPQRYTSDNPISYSPSFYGHTIPIPQYHNTTPTETLPLALQASTQTITHTTTITTAIQTDPNYTCPTCSWICDTEADSQKTLYIRVIFLQQLIKQLHQIEDFIDDKFGRWAEIITHHTFPSTPAIILPPLIQILDGVSAAGETQTETTHHSPNTHQVPRIRT